MAGNCFLFGKSQNAIDADFKRSVPSPLIHYICVSTGLECLNRILANVIFMKNSHLEAESSICAVFYLKSK
jgi:hypothetical protein